MTANKQSQSVKKVRLQDSVGQDLDGSTSTSKNAKIINDYQKLRDLLRTKHGGQTVVCTIGSWDILHEGHVAYLKDARALGHVLVVGVDSDEAYALYKKDSVIYPEEDRLALVSALRYVDYVTLVSDVNAGGEWQMDLIKIVCPDVFICNTQSYPPEQRKRLKELCSDVRPLPFHDSLPSVIASIKLKRARRANVERTAYVAAVISFMFSLVFVYQMFLPALSRALLRWSTFMKQDVLFFPSFTWAQFFGGMTVGLFSAIIAGVVRHKVLIKR